MMPRYKIQKMPRCERNKKKKRDRWNSIRDKGKPTEFFLFSSASRWNKIWLMPSGSSYRYLQRTFAMMQARVGQVDPHVFWHSFLLPDSSIHFLFPSHCVIFHNFFFSNQFSTPFFPSHILSLLLNSNCCEKHPRHLGSDFTVFLALLQTSSRLDFAVKVLRRIIHLTFMLHIFFSSIFRLDFSYV